MEEPKNAVGEPSKQADTAARAVPDSNNVASKPKSESKDGHSDSDVSIPADPDEDTDEDEYHDHAIVKQQLSDAVKGAEASWQANVTSMNVSDAANNAVKVCRTLDLWVHAQLGSAIESMASMTVSQGCGVVRRLQRRQQARRCGTLKMLFEKSIRRSPAVQRRLLRR